MKAIPISEIDSLIKAAEDTGLESLKIVISNLRGLKEKAIPTIPISKIDEKINYLKEECWVIERGNFPEWVRVSFNILEDLKE